MPPIAAACELPDALDPGIALRSGKLPHSDKKDVFENFMRTERETLKETSALTDQKGQFRVIVLVVFEANDWTITSFD